MANLTRNREGNINKSSTESRTAGKGKGLSAIQPKNNQHDWAPSCKST